MGFQRDTCVGVKEIILGRLIRITWPKVDHRQKQHRLLDLGQRDKQAWVHGKTAHPRA